MPTEMKLTVAGVLLFVTLLVVWAFGPLIQVGAGERGVVMKWGAVQDQILNEGIHWRTPIQTQVAIVDVKINKVQVRADSASRDLQNVSSEIAVNYHVNPQYVNLLWQEIGKDYVSRVLEPSIQESMKAITARYTAEELITERSAVSREAQGHLKERLAPYHIIADELSIIDFDFSDEFNMAIEAKQSAEQKALKAQRDLERVKMEAQQKIEQAKAEAESLRLQKQHITDKMVQLRQIEVQRSAIEKWNGVLPTWIMSGDSNQAPIPFITIAKVD